MSIEIQVRTLNQNKADFEQWLKSLPHEKYAIAGDCMECWLAQWFTSQGFKVWGVFPTYLSDYPNSVVIEEPGGLNKITLDKWAFRFGSLLDKTYSSGLGEPRHCNRDQALELLGQAEAL